MKPTNELLVPTAPAIAQLVEMALATCISENTRKNYRIQITAFLESKQPFNREGVARHLSLLREKKVAPSSVVVAFSAIKKLAREAQIRNLISQEELFQIASVDPGKVSKTRQGMWLTIEQVRQLLALPDRRLYYGKRDACILNVMVGCGLRRAEMANVTWDRYREVEGRMCLVNLNGKGNKDRTIPVPLWAQGDIDAWFLVSRNPPPSRERPCDPPVKDNGKGQRKYSPDHMAGGLAEDGLFALVERYGNRMGVNLAPHDLRRSLAQMMRRAGAPLEQIQLMLGHAHLSTTSVYLGSALEMRKGDAAVDQLDLDPNRHRLPQEPVRPNKLLLREKTNAVRHANYRRQRSAYAREREMRYEAIGRIKAQEKAGIKPAPPPEPEGPFRAMIKTMVRFGFLYRVTLTCGHAFEATPAKVDRDQLYIGKLLRCDQPHERGQALPQEDPNPSQNAPQSRQEAPGAPLAAPAAPQPPVSRREGQERDRECEGKGEGGEPCRPNS